MIAVASGTAAIAQTQPVTSTSDRVTGPGVRPGDAARTDPVFRHTVACTIQRQPGRTRNLLYTIPGTFAEQSIITSFQSRLDQCFPRLGALGFTGNLLRGGIAEVYYHRAFPTGLPRETQAASDLTATWALPRIDRRRVTQLESAHATARCLVLRQPALVSDFLAHAPFSAEEGRAMRALQSDLSACLDSGVAFAASRQSLRGLLVEAALHYGEAHRDGFRTAIRHETPSR